MTIISEGLARHLSLSPSTSKLDTILTNSISVFLYVLAIYLSFKFTQLVGRKLLSKLAVKTTFLWDDIITEQKTFNLFALVIPGVLSYYLLPLFIESETLTSVTLFWIKLYIVWATWGFVWGLNRAISTYVEVIKLNYSLAVKTVLQMVTLLSFLVSILLTLSLILNKNVFILFTGLGAMVAILAIVFRDTLLGLVAGIQLSTNKMVEKGDWVEVPKFNADGRVINVNLTTVFVENWDKSVTHIPSYSLISESFKNWRTIREKKLRSIRRVILLTSKSITPLSAEKYELVKHLVPTHTPDLTNLSAFRHLMEEALKQNPLIDENHPAFIRMLPPTAQGLQIEFYAFTSAITFEDYERLCSMLYDTAHVICIKLDIVPV